MRTTKHLIRLRADISEGEFSNFRDLIILSEHWRFAVVCSKGTFLMQFFFTAISCSRDLCASIP